MAVLEVERPRVVHHPVEVVEATRLDWEATPAPGSPSVLSRAKTRGRRVCALNARALALWPGLDRRALSRCSGDLRRVATYVSRRTSLPLEAIVALLTAAGEPSHAGPEPRAAAQSA